MSGSFLEFAQQNIFVVVCFVLSGAMIMWTNMRKPTGSVILDNNGVTRLINSEEPLIIDLRKPEEFGRGHFPGAVNVPFAELGSRIGSLDLTRPLLVIDRGGNETPKATSMLSKAGAKKMYVLKGGLLAWMSASLPLAVH